MRNSQKTLAQIKSGLLKDFGIKVVNVCKILKGYSSITYEAISDKNKIIIKTDQNGRENYMQEIVINKLLADHGVPVPVIIDYDLRSPSFGFAILIMKRLVGIQLHRKKQQNDTYHEAGRILRKIHEIKLTGFGCLVIKDGEISGNCKKWSDYIKSRYLMSNYKSLLKRGLINRNEYDRVSKALQKILASSSVESTLLHNDYHSEHIFVSSRGKEIIGLIDFEQSIIGDRFLDVAKSMYFQIPKHRAFFMRGYGLNKKDRSIVDAYIVLVATQKMFWSFDNNDANMKKVRNESMTKMKEIAPLVHPDESR